MKRKIAKLSTLMALMTGLAHAETFLVTKTADENGECLPGDCALREAILLANDTPGEDTILVPEGYYPLTIEGVKEYEGRTGDLNIEDPVRIRGAGANRTIVDARGIDRVLTVFDPTQSGADTLIEDLALTGGAGPFEGGGAWIGAMDTTFLRCRIEGNSAEFGGGLWFALSNSALIDSAVVGNVAKAKGGGVGRIHIGFTPSGLRIVNSTISGNSAFRGGGIAFENFGTMELTNSTIVDNSANFASAIDYDSAFTDATRYRNILLRGTCDSFQSGLPASDGGNLESPGNTCGLVHPSDQTGVPDLLLGLLTDNGGPTPTHALLPGSPAIDAGLAPCEALDQRGYPRPLDGDGNGIADCDAGAFELERGVDVVDVPMGVHALAILMLLLASAGWRRLQG